jgi:hypothetical protein
MLDGLAHDDERSSQIGGDHSVEGSRLPSAIGPIGMMPALFDVVLPLTAICPAFASGPAIAGPSFGWRRGQAGNSTPQSQQERDILRR